MNFVARAYKKFCLKKTKHTWSLWSSCLLGPLHHIYRHKCCLLFDLVNSLLLFLGQNRLEQLIHIQHQCVVGLSQKPTQSGRPCLWRPYDADPAREPGHRRKQIWSRVCDELLVRFLRRQDVHLVQKAVQRWTPTNHLGYWSGSSLNVFFLTGQIHNNSPHTIFRLARYHLSSPQSHGTISTPGTSPPSKTWGHHHCGRPKPQ